MSNEPEWCAAWTSYDDVTGEGQQTFEHECGQIKGHAGKHTCMGHISEWDGSMERCNTEWHNYGRPK